MLLHTSQSMIPLQELVIKEVAMKRKYDSPEFDLLKFSVADVICDSRTEGAGGGGDWGAGTGEPSEE